jgi:Flp pilus assembly secretin CpaC/plasmid stability protein
VQKAAQNPPPPPATQPPAVSSVSAPAGEPEQKLKKHERKESPPGLCAGESARACGVGQHDFKKAAKLFTHGVESRKADPEQTLKDFEEAAQLVPRDVRYAEAREILRQQLVHDHTKRGDELAVEKRTIEASAEFRQALELDPGNPYATQQLRQLTRARVSPQLSFVEPEASQEVMRLHPKPGHRDLALTGDVRNAYSQIGTAFGIKITLDEGIHVALVNLDLTHVTFAQAMNAVALVTKTYWMPVSPDEVLVAADTAAKHKELDHWVLRTFYLPEVSTPQEMSDIVNLLRTVFELHLLSQAAATQTVTMRGPAPLIEAATQFLQSLWAGKPQVMLDVDVYEVSRQLLDTLGVNMPLQFSLFNIPQAAVAAVGGNSIQSLISQINSSGGQINSSTLSALEAQLQQQSSLFSQPVATFGGGISLMGVPIPAATLNFSRSDSVVKSLESAHLQAGQGDTATFRVGERYPVLNASYSAMSAVPSQLSSLLSSSVLSQLGLGSGSSSTANSALTLGTFPSFSFEDLGLTIKAKPMIHAGGSVTLDLELQLESLGANAVNGVPVLNNRAYKGVFDLMNDEPGVVASSLTRNESLSLSGMPGVGNLPLLGTVLTSRTNEHDQDELLLLITPHIMSAGPAHHGPAIPIPRSEP